MPYRPLDRRTAGQAFSAAIGPVLEEKRAIGRIYQARLQNQLELQRQQAMAEYNDRLERQKEAERRAYEQSTPQYQLAARQLGVPLETPEQKRAGDFNAFTDRYDYERANPKPTAMTPLAPTETSVRAAVGQEPMAREAQRTLARTKPLDTYLGGLLGYAQATGVDSVRSGGTTGPYLQTPALEARADSVSAIRDRAQGVLDSIYGAKYNEMARGRAEIPTPETPDVPRTGMETWDVDTVIAAAERGLITDDDYESEMYRRLLKNEITQTDYDAIFGKDQ